MLEMSCLCMRMPEKLENYVCCDRCGGEALQTRFNEKFQSR
jgi:hypothetical protein